MNKWQPMETAPKDGTEILLTGTIDVYGDEYPDDILEEMKTQKPVVIGHYVKAKHFRSWNTIEENNTRRVQVRDEYECEYWFPDYLEPTAWQPLPVVE